MTIETAGLRAPLASTRSQRTGRAADAGGAAPFVAAAQTIEETGLDFSMILDLVVKAIYFAGRPAARQIAAQLALPFPVIDEVLAFMKREQLAEVVGSSGHGRAALPVLALQQGAGEGRGGARAQPLHRPGAGAVRALP